MRYEKNFFTKIKPKETGTNAEAVSMPVLNAGGVDKMNSCAPAGA